MEHFVEVYNLFYRIGWPGLLSVPESGIGDEDLFRGIGKDKFIIEFYPTNLIEKRFDRGSALGYPRGEIALRRAYFEMFSSSGRWSYLLLAFG
jgi:hypothetical protein